MGLDFDARVAWPVYDWMGVAKAALESLARYLARDVGSAGVRVNLVAAGPARTLAAKSIPGFDRFEEVWSERAPLGWDVTDTKAVGQVEQMHLSRCFQASAGELGCASCHDPHELPAVDERTTYYRKRCLDCHGADLQEAKLDLRTLSTLLRGGESGPAVIPGDPENSLPMS